MRLRALVRWLMLVVALGAEPSAAADPYEIPARWVEGEDVLSPVGVDFSFTRIEYVPGLGVLAYGDQLLLRVDSEENPHVTLGIAKRRFSSKSPSYTSVVPLADGARLMSIGRVTSEPTAFRRDARVEWADVSDRKSGSYPFPAPSDVESTWWSIGLFAGSDRRVLALAGRTPPIPQPMLETPPSPAVEQRVYELRGTAWIPLSNLEPTIFTVADACLAGGSLFAVGTKLVRDNKGKLVLRRGGAAELARDAWTLGTLRPPTGTEIFGLDRVACGPARDYVVAVGSSAATRSGADRRALDGPSLLYAFDSRKWTQIADHPGAPTAKKHPDYTHVTAVAIAPDRTLWVAYERPDDPAHALYRYAARRWQPYALPRVPSVARYVIHGITFDPEGRGWAISNLEGAADRPESRGILLRYDGKAWVQKPWTWSPLEQRWWGLFGKLS